MRFNMESLETFQSRTVAAVSEIMKNDRKENIIIVSHGGVINCFIHYLTHGKNGIGKLKLKNTSISTFRYTNPDWQIISLNNTRHLQLKQN